MKGFVVPLLLETDIGISQPLQGMKKNRYDLGWLFMDIYSGYPGVGRSERFFKFAGDFMRFLYAEFRLETTSKSQVYAFASFADVDS
jgi:hypothetical protein